MLTSVDHLVFQCLLPPSELEWEQVKPRDSLLSSIVTHFNLENANVKVSCAVFSSMSSSCPVCGSCCSGVCRVYFSWSSGGFRGC